MGNAIRQYLRGTIKAGQTDAFLSNAAAIVKATEETEPGCLECSAFVDPNTRACVWMMSFDDTKDYFEHLGNPTVGELAAKMDELVDVERIELFGAIEQSFLQEASSGPMGKLFSWMPEHSSFLRLARSGVRKAAPDTQPKKGVWKKGAPPNAAPKKAAPKKAAPKKAAPKAAPKKAAAKKPAKRR